MKRLLIVGVLLCVGCTETATKPNLYFCPVNRRLEVLHQVKIDCPCGTIHTTSGTLTGRPK